MKNLFTIRSKILWLCGILSSLMFGILLYLAIIINQNSNLLQKQATNLKQQSLINQSIENFSRSRYWLYDLQVSWLNEAETNAIQAQSELEENLKALDKAGTDASAIRSTVKKFNALMLKAVDAYIDDNRVLGNSFVSESRSLGSQIDQQLNDWLTQANSNALLIEKTANDNNRKLYDVSLIIMFSILAVMAAFGVVLIGDFDRRQKNAIELQAAMTKVEDAANIKAMFLANMSHEIRTPMNAIIGLSYLALKTDLNTKQQDYLNKIYQAGTSLLGIVNDILDFSKIEAGKLHIEQAPFDLETVLLNISTMNGQTAFAKGIEFIIYPLHDIPAQLIGDSLRLGQILSNLVSNAIKFTAQGEVSIKTLLLEKTDTRVKLEFQIKDSGIGLTHEQLNKLFTPFTQSDNSTTRKFGGTGLGLSISKRLAEIMSGEIRVSSEPGIGSCFSFIAWFHYTNQAKASLIWPLPLNNARVLIVDDIESSRQVLQEILQLTPLNIEVCDSGSAAVEMVLNANQQEKPFNLVLMDWQMPGMDGISAAAEIQRRLPAEKRPYIVLVTAYEREEVYEAAKHETLNAVIIKPVMASTLIDCLVELFQPNDIKHTEIINHTTDETHSDLQGMRVLLTEDNTINQQIACELMASVGIKVSTANNGQEALDILHNSKDGSFDIILMDIQMPIMDGYEASRLIRQERRFDQLPVVAMTAHAMTEERERCLAAGMNDHISKPINPAALFDRLQYWYAKNASRQIAPQTPAIKSRLNTKPAENAQRNIEFSAEDNAVFTRLEKLPGFSLLNGLNYVNNDKNLYLKLLRQASQSEADCSERIQAALDKNDRATGRLYAHTLKGLAATFGANELAALAEQVELILRQPDNTTDLRPLLHNITQSMTALDHALNNTV